MKITQVTPGIITIPPNGWGAVEKVIEVNNTEESQKKQQMLQDTIQKLRQELQNKTQEITDLNQKLNNRHFTSDVKGIYLDGSNLNKTIKTN